MPQTHHAIGVTRPLGPLEVLTVPTPSPNSHQILVKLLKLGCKPGYVSVWTTSVFEDRIINSFSYTCCSVAIGLWFVCWRERYDTRGKLGG